MIFVYGEPYDSKGPSRGRRFESLSDLPRWMERAIRSDAARTGLRSGVLEVDRDVDWRLRDRLDDRREDEERENGVG